jgi:hypothetical protein
VKVKHAYLARDGWQIRLDQGSQHYAEANAGIEQCAALLLVRLQYNPELMVLIHEEERDKSHISDSPAHDAA